MTILFLGSTYILLTYIIFRLQILYLRLHIKQKSHKMHRGNILKILLMFYLKIKVDM